MRIIAFISFVFLSFSIQAQAPTFFKTFTPDNIGPGSVSTLTFTIINNGSVGITNIAFTDNLPAGLTIADPANASVSNSSGTLTAPDGGGTIIFVDGTLGIGESMTISVDVTGSTPGVHMNVSSVLSSSEPDAGAAIDDLTISTNVPGFYKSFAPSSVSLGGTSTLTLIIDNTSNGSPISNLDFVDNLPPGMVIASPANASTTCGTPTIPPTLTAIAGSNTITLDANGIASFPAVAAGSSCIVSVDVKATGIGDLDNITNDLLADFDEVGKASATLESTVT
ncbi:MAG: DUF11 domain-containing protein, partial [Saprospiraceae bacterium]|nr:DUF11 domain-containing protein [Saprospiraceae bacterium]